ncbi:hypothetical protein PENTCL1PPCAC_18498, partial [Pristionchus entomophagus]
EGSIQCAETIGWTGKNNRPIITFSVEGDHIIESFCQDPPTSASLACDSSSWEADCTASSGSSCNALLYTSKKLTCTQPTSKLMYGWNLYDHAKSLDTPGPGAGWKGYLAASDPTGVKLIAFVGSLQPTLRV